MSAIIISQRVTHYEVVGRGQPVIFLHSWLGSWRAWMPTMEAIADRYRAFALDFWGFGESAAARESSLDAYAAQLLALIDTLGIQTPHLVGHGLGGVVAIRAASAYPERFSRIVVAGTPVIGSALRGSFQPGGLRRLLQRDPVTAPWARLVREAAAGDPAFDDLLADVEATAPESLASAVEAITATDLRPALQRLRRPLLAIYGGRDRLLSREHAQAIEAESRGPRHVLMLDGSGHFPFLDQPAQFTRALLEFLGGERPVTPKQMWKRRVSRREFL
jgi:3-oxoadipate enol-lactonase